MADRVETVRAAEVGCTPTEDGVVLAWLGGQLVLTGSPDEVGRLAEAISGSVVVAVLGAG